MGGPITRVAVLFVAGLIAAGVCFWLLESTANVDSAAWDLGGAFAGFVVTIVVLNHVWEDERDDERDLATRFKEAGAEIVYHDVVKLLDLRSARPTASTPEVELYSEGREDEDIDVPKATTFQDGTVVMWSMVKPPRLARIKVGWQWSPRRPNSEQETR